MLRLVDCSLLVPPATGPDGRSRYLMLQTLRGYGLDRLREACEEHEAAAALAVYARDVAEHAAAQMAVRSGEKPAALWLDAEDAVVHEGLAWALDHDPPAALRLVAALAQWWIVRGRWIQAIGLLQRALEQTGPGDSGWYSAHTYLGKLLARTSDSSAIGHFTAVVDALTGRPPSADLVQALVGRSSVLRNTAGLEEAASDANAALTLARRMGDATGEALALALALAELSTISSYADDAGPALERARQAQMIDRALMPGWRARSIELLLPWALESSGHLEGAADLLAGALAQSEAAGDLHDQADAACSSAGGDQGLVTDGDPDAQPCLVQSAFEGGLADPGDLGGLLRGESFDVTQHEGGPQRGRQLGQGPAQGPAQFAVLGLPGWVESGWRGQLQFAHPDRDSGRAPRSALQRAVGLVDRNPVQPGEVAGLAAEPGNALPGAEHDVLRHVLGLAAVAE